MTRCLAFFLVVASMTKITHAQQLCWLDINSPTDRLECSDLGGRGIAIVLDEDNITCFTIDPDTERVYWGRATSGGQILRSNLDGSSTVILINDAANPSDIALDIPGGKIYWSDVALGKIHRANFDGSGVELLTTVGLHVHALDLDLPSSQMYYTVTSLDSLQRADLDAQNPEVLVTGQPSIQDVQIEIGSGHMYYSVDSVWRADLDGTNAQVVLPTGSGADGLSLDTEAGHLYFSDRLEGSIRRADLDGTNVQTIVSGLSNPRAIQVIPVTQSAIPAVGTMGLLVMGIGLIAAGAMMTKRRHRHRSPRIGPVVASRMMS